MEEILNEELATFENILAYPENYTVEQIRELELYYRKLAESEEDISDKVEPLNKASKLKVVALALEAKFLERKFDPPLRSSESDEIGIGGVLVLDAKIIETIRERTGALHKVTSRVAGIEFILEALKDSSEMDQKIYKFFEQRRTKIMLTVNKTLSNTGAGIKRDVRLDKVERLFDSIYGARERKSSLLYVGDTQMLTDETVLIRMPVNKLTLSKRYETLDLMIDDPDKIVAEIKKNIDKLIKAFHIKLTV